MKKKTNKVTSTTEVKLGKAVVTKGMWYTDKNNNYVLLDNDYNLFKTIKEA